MTEWGMLLLCAYIALGATGRLTWRQAGRVGLVLTAIVIAAVMVSYSSTTPTDNYIRSIDATVYQSGKEPRNGIPSTEDVAGAQAATWGTTDHSDNGLGTGSGSSGTGGGN
jgi:Na+(H+)/acetate symporter ActP